MKKKTLLAFTVLAALFCMLAASCSNAVPKGGEVVISFSSQELKAAVNSASRQAGSTYTLRVWLEVNGQSTKVQEQSITDIESSEDKSFSFGEFEVGSSVIAYAQVIAATDKGNVLFMTGNSGAAKTIKEDDNPLEITMQYEGQGIGTISLTVRFLLEGDDGNYDLDPDIQPAFIELGLDQIEEFDSITLNDYEGVNEQLLKIIDMGYVLNEEKTFAKENEPDFTKEYVVMNFFFDKEGGFSTDVEYDGEIVINENKGLDISLEYDRDDIYLNQGTFTLHPKEANGTELWDEVANPIEWSAKILYKGVNVNYYGEQYYEVISDADNVHKLVLEKHMPLPSAGDYQVYVTAKLPENSSTPAIYSSQTFDISIPDRHIYDISDDVDVLDYDPILHNVYLTGDVKAEDWEDWDWDVLENNPNVLAILMTKYSTKLKSLIFEGEVDTPDYDSMDVSLFASRQSFSYDFELRFNNKVHLGEYMFSCADIGTLYFTTEESTVSVGCFTSSPIYYLDLTGVKTIEDDAFAYCRSITQLRIPESVTSIGQGAFYNSQNEGLTTVSFADEIGWKCFDSNDEQVTSFTINDALSVMKSSSYKLIKEN